MARNTSMFKNGRSVTTVQKKPVSSVAAVDVSVEALACRATEQRQLPEQPLTVTFICQEARKEKRLQFQFSELADKYPHHRDLIKLLLTGQSLSLRGVMAATSIIEANKSVYVFVDFLNNGNNLLGSKICCFSDIEGETFQAYKMYLVSNSTFARSRRSKKYLAIANAVKSLRKKFPNNPLVGQSMTFPRAPQGKNKAIEGYNEDQLRAIIRCCIVDIKAIRKFHTDYQALDSKSPQFEELSGCSVKPYLKLNPETLFIQILSTIKHRWPEYPFYMPEARAKAFFSPRSNPNFELYKEDLKLRYSIDLALVACSAKISFMGGTLERGAINAAQHFVPQTIFPYLLLTQIATGFNAECLKYMTDNLNEVMLDDMLNPDNLAVIYGYKQKTSKLIPVKSKKKKAHGAYSLLKYVESVVKQFNDSEYYVRGALFQYSRSKMDSKGDPGLLCSFHGRMDAYGEMSRNFIKRHGLEDLIGKSTIDSRMVRSGFATVSLEGGNNSRQVGEQLGHADAYETGDTADSHYLSDKASVAQKNKVVARIQNQMVSDLLNYKSRIVESLSLQKLREAIHSAKDEVDRISRIHVASQTLNLDEKIIVHLLDAGVQTYILVCLDMTKPTWRDHERVVKNDQCRQYNKCCLCGQSIVFPEALPYIAKRIIDLEEMQARLTAAEWTLNYGDEYDAWYGISNTWNNKLQVEYAWEAARRGDILLPKVMKGGTR
ncbi:MAG: hypothetical protein ACOYL3_05785 [Desulfuromonadaceae bacterium]